MKKMKWIILIIILGVLGIIDYFILQKEEDLSKYLTLGKGDLMVEYVVSSNFHYEPAGFTYKIRIYDNLKAEYEVPEKISKKEITKDVYDEIIKKAFSSKFIRLGNISDPNTLDGVYEYMYIHKDGQEISVGGSNPNNKYFNEVAGMMVNLFKEERK